MRIDRAFNAGGFPRGTWLAATAIVLMQNTPRSQSYEQPGPAAARRTTPARPAASPGTASLVIVNAKVWTGVDLPTGDAAPTAVAVSGATIVAVGDDLSMRTWIGKDPHVIDAHGQRVIPGMTDCHAHIIAGGLQLTRLTLRQVSSREEFIRAVEREAKTKRSGQWVLGGRWSTESWPDSGLPRKEWIDPVTPETPVFLSRMDGHEALVNSVALRLAGIDSSGPVDPPGGQIERDRLTHDPTGIVKESAMDLIRSKIPQPTLIERLDALRRAMKHANSLGLTSVHDMADPDDLPVLKRAYSDGVLTLRLTVYLQTDDWADSAEAIADFGINSDTLRVAGLKGYMDGSLGSRTAYMRKAYGDAANDAVYPSGQLTAFAASPGALQRSITAGNKRGLQLAVHAIGDEANHLLLDAYEAVLGRTASGKFPPRVEHAQHLLVADIPRFAQLGVVASMQPYHKADDGRYAEKALGRARLAGSYAFRQLLDAGALLCFGSDWPVVTMNPFAGIDAAVNAVTSDGRVWLPSHSLNLEEALRAYTVCPARAVRRDASLGTLQVGKLADIVILADDPFAVPRHQLGSVRVDRTIVGGIVVFARPQPRSSFDNT
ncbi:MAG: amidohydrolase [Phycisphaerae bacterium]